MESIETVCANLEKAFANQKDDPVSLVTIIDIYNEQVNKEAKREDKAQYLKKLSNLLSENPDVVNEIGWDLPKGLLKFHSLENLLPHYGLRRNAIVVNIMSCFHEIALHGNPKECLLTGCQLLSELSVEELEHEVEQYNKSKDVQDSKGLRAADEEGETGAYIQSPAEFLWGLSSYVLFELIQTVLRRIQTLYPSRFLGMAVSAISKFVRSNIDHIDNTAFVLRRVFTFCKNYNPMELSLNSDVSDELDKNELKKISEDEAVLQGKVLRSLSTFGMGYCLKNKYLGTDVRYYLSLSNEEFEEPTYVTEMIGICSRFYQLAYSFDIDIKEEFLNLLKETRSIYSSLPPEADIANDDAARAIGQVVYQLSYTFQLQRLAKSKGLELDPSGVLALSGLHYLQIKQHLIPDISVKDSIYLFIRCSTPALFSSLFASDVSEEISRYWLWVSITNTSYKKLKSQLSEIPPYISNVFLQMLLLTNCNQRKERRRMITFTLLTRVLCLMPEEIAFAFALDTLLTCPYAKPKICILGILKDMILRTCQCKQDIAEQMKNLKLDVDNSSSEKTVEPPALPSRPFIVINEDRMASLHSVALIAITKAVEEKFDKEGLILVQSYLNFFAAVREKWDKGLLKAIHDEVASQFDVKTSETLPEVGFIKIANETLAKYT